MLAWICWEGLWIEACSIAVGRYVFEIDGLQVDSLTLWAVAPEPDRQEGGHLTRIVLNRIMIDRDRLRKAATWTNNGYRQREDYYYDGYYDHYRERGWSQPMAPRHRDRSHIRGIILAYSHTLGWSYRSKRYVRSVHIETRLVNLRSGK
jgi:hypothetical protein